MRPLLKIRFMYISSMRQVSWSRVVLISKFLAFLLVILLLIAAWRMTHLHAPEDFSHLLNLHGKISKVPSEALIFDDLLADYKKKIQDLKTNGFWRGRIDIKTCNSSQNVRPCVDTTCTKPYPRDSQDVLLDLMNTADAVDSRLFDIVQGIFHAPPTGKHVMIVTAASANHFDESQALIKNLHEDVFPYLTNFTFAYYDLGLWSWQRKQLQKHCRCEVRSFPHEHMPWKHQNHLNCYTWKPFIIQANLPTTDVLVWADASVRIEQNILTKMVEETEKKGMVTYRGLPSVAEQTSGFTFRHFREHTCNFSPVTEIQATFMMFHNERFIRQAVIRPWVACALSPDCMCPGEPSNIIMCMGPRKYNMCHRFDQSAISIVLEKLFRGHKDSLASPLCISPHVRIEREDKVNYFAQLEKK